MTITSPDPTTTGPSAPQHRSKPPSTWGAIRSALKRNVVAQLAVFIIAVVVMVGLLGPLLSSDPLVQNLTLRLQPPSWAGGPPGHFLGTDQLGRDLFARVLYGTRVSLLVGVAATVLSGLLGTAIGLISGYTGGWTDTIFMRLADVQLAFPTILLALVIIAVLGPSLLFVVLVLGITGWVSYARVIRAEVLTLREREFVTAARATGVSGPMIILRHLLPNVIAPFITVATLQVAAMIIAESSLSYLGLGVPPTIPTWGGTLAEGQLYLQTSWWISVFSGLAILLTTLSINIVGDMLRDVADPKAYR